MLKIVKSVGSIVQVPGLPLIEWVLMIVLGSIKTWLPEVSIVPPLLPRPFPWALKLPPTISWPLVLFKSTTRDIVPPPPLLRLDPLAEIVPASFIELVAVKMILPPLLVTPFASKVPELMTLPVNSVTAFLERMI